MYRRRQNEIKYRKKTHARDDCPFCDPAEIDYRRIEQTEHAYVMPHAIPYDYWENHRVLECLMVIPKRHVAHLGKLTDAEMLDIMKVIARYEANGYNIYARTSKSIRRTQGHQHTHLIKIDQREPRLSLLIAKPYWLFRI